MVGREASVRMRVTIPYGRGELSVEFPSDCVVETLEPPTKPALDDAAAELVRALDAPATGPAVAGPPLAELAGPHARVALVVADWTRACAYPELLPRLLDELNRCGTPDEAIALLIAYGTHARQSDEATRNLYGSEVCRRVEIVHHDCDAPDLIDVGTTPAGTRVALNRRYVEADVAITVGPVAFHYFAGFGGGPKLVFPGLASRDGIMTNHALSVEQMLAEPRRLKGELDQNACARDIREAVTLAPPAFSVQCLAGERGVLSAIIAGPWDASHEAACDRLRATAMIDVGVRYDVVVASCGGWPRDINLIQAHKSIDNACELVRDGGTLLVAARCDEGVGSDTFLGWFDLDDEAFAAKLARGYELHGGTTFSMRRKARRCHIYMKSGLPDAAVRQIGVTPAPDLQAALDEALAKHPGGPIAWLPHAAETVARRLPV
jgi:nickel-dependent lactate racemase